MMHPQTPLPVRPPKGSGVFEWVFWTAWLVGVVYGADTFGWKGGLAAAIGVPLFVFGIMRLFEK